MAKNKAEQENIHSAQEGDLGKMLISIREGAGYSLSQTAEAMCLSEDLLSQLENEEFDVLPEPPYIRGYLRNYAKLAEVEADELISTYESLRGADPSDLNYHFKSSAKIHSNHKKSVSPVIMQVLFLGILFAALFGISMIPAVNTWIKLTWENFSNQTSSQSVEGSNNPLLTGTMPVPTPLSSDEATPNTSGNNATNETTSDPNNDTGQANSSEQVNNPAQANVTTQTSGSEQGNNGSQTNASEQTATTANENATPTTENVANTTTTNNSTTESIKVGEQNTNEALIPASTDGSINVKLVFNKEVWMRIRDGKKQTVFEGQNPAGEEKQLSLKKPLTFRVGNAQGLSLFVDGKAVDISRYIKGSVANFTLE